MIGLSDQKHMEGGKYIGSHVEDVPGSYLLWLYENGHAASSLVTYIESNIHIIRIEAGRDPNGND